ncbi:unnamed protein product [Lasius platythorax]|uniref:Uncharacterized protein n=1 Tax=Lasius platythorax TaxID=488582 RepID=A0AAV2NV13_9HYME
MRKRWFVMSISDLSEAGRVGDRFGKGSTERLVKRHNVPPFKGASTGMRRRADDVTRIDEARDARSMLMPEI